MAGSSHRCLSDDQLLDVLADPAASRLALGECAPCGVRFEQLAGFVAMMRDEASAEADAVFTDVYLAEQRARILERITPTASARIISFPDHRVASSPRRRIETPAVRWIAGAAAAGLLLGVAVGRVYDGRLQIDSTTGAQARAPRIALDAPSVSAVNDEQLLFEIDAALSARPAAQLAALDALTPSLPRPASNPQ